MHSYSRYASFLILLLIFSAHTEAKPNASATQDPVAETGFDPAGYYTFRQDFRKCRFPLCGGYFVKAVNRALTRCTNGKLQAECYVAEVINDNNLDLEKAALLNGRIQSQKYNGSRYGVLVLSAAYSAATETSGQGKFVGLENNGIMCITSPCFSYDEYVLNSVKVGQISGIDLEASGAPAEVVEKALTIMAEGGVLLASGVNRQTEEMAGTGITFVANQIYLPIVANVK